MRQVRAPSLLLRTLANTNIERCFRRTSRARCTHPLYTERNPDPSDARSPRAHRRATRSRLYVSPPSSAFACFSKGGNEQSSWACNSPRASLQATPLARRTLASCTAPCLRSRSSARSTASIASARSPTSLRAATLTVALGASQVPRATPHKVCLCISPSPPSR